MSQFVLSADCSDSWLLRGKSHNTRQATAFQLLKSWR